MEASVPIPDATIAARHSPHIAKGHIHDTPDCLDNRPCPGLVACADRIAGPASAQRSQAEGFSRFELQSARNSYGYQRVQFSDGTRAERFELRHGDCPRVTGDCTADRNRIEFSEQSPAQRVGSQVWVAWSLYLLPDFPNQGGRRDSNVTLGQFHQPGPSGPELLFNVFGATSRRRSAIPTGWMPIR